jgi:hypothetical protein
MDINEVIQNGLLADEGIRDINIHPSGKSHNKQEQHSAGKETVSTKSLR